MFRMPLVPQQEPREGGAPAQRADSLGHWNRRLILNGRLEGWGATDTGRVRENNEDAWLIDEEVHTAILADGMGGANCGEVGSAVTVETVCQYLHSPRNTSVALEELANGAIREANRRVIQA